jgi:CRISPR system Cascade subunit CasA
MNVAFDPWIPVITLTGERAIISLCDAFTNGEQYADLAVRPHERVSLMRLFLCVAHASLKGPKNYPEWCDVPKKLPGAAGVYLKDWKDSFELFHKEKPWLQISELDLIPSETDNDVDEEKGWSRLGKLCFTRASGNNSTLFDHESDVGNFAEYSTAELALNVLTFQNFFVAGGKASSRVWGKLEMKNPPNPKGGPCSGKSILFTFLRGRNLIESIGLNLNTHEDLKLHYGEMNDWLGVPIWEQPITNPYDESAIANATRTHIGRFVPQTRHLRIHEDRKRVLLGAGFLYPKFQDENNIFKPDIFATAVVTRDDQTVLLSARPGKAIWRQLHALVVRRKNAESKNRGALCLLNIPVEMPCELIVCGMITNPKQAAEIVDLVESVFHVPARLQSPEGTAVYESEVRNAERISSRLGWAIEDYRSEIDGGWLGRVKGAGPKTGELKAKLHSIATTHYWTIVENNLSLLMAHIEAIGTDTVNSTRETWQKMLFSTACEAYRLACGQETPRQIKAFAKGFQKLTKRQDNSDTEIEKPQTQEVEV